MLYVGKSKHLQARVSSYFRSTKYLPKKTTVLIPQINQLDLVLTETEFEALLLEAKLIRELTPKYNQRLKDHQSLLYIVITDEQFPRVLLRRKTDLEKGLIFGPFLSSHQTKQVLKISRRLFPFCNAGPKARRACFYYHLGLCPGVCAGKTTARKYRANIRRLARFLAADFDQLRSSLNQEMRRAARLQKYQSAQEKKNLIEALASLGNASLSRASSFPELPLTAKDRLAALVKILSREGISLDLKRKIRIEGYDVSHLQGKQSTAAMVVFIAGLPTKEEYRHFQIRTSWTPDDPRMTAEVIRRRLLHPDWDLPDLIMIDGGQPQLQAIKKEFKVLTRLPGKIPFIGLAKRPDRLLIPTRSELLTLSPPPVNPGLQLLMAIRDEAHRFAKSYHLKLRDKAIIG